MVSVPTKVSGNFSKTKVIFFSGECGGDGGGGQFFEVPWERARARSQSPDTLGIRGTRFPQDPPRGPWRKLRPRQDNGVLSG